MTLLKGYHSKQDYKKELMDNLFPEEATKYSVHVHFHGTPTPEFLEAFNRMLDIAAKVADVETKLKVQDIDDSLCVYCKERPAVKPLWICRECVIAYNKEKQRERESCGEFCRCGALRTLSIRRGLSFCSNCDKQIE